MARKTYDGKQFLTVKDVAAELQLSPSTIRRYCEKGELKLVRDPVNNYRYVSRESIEDLKKRFREAANGASTATPRVLESLRAEFDRLLARMQTSQAQSAMKSAFGASPKQLGRAALATARKRA